MRYVLLAVLLAALGCRPARGTDDRARVPMIEGFYREPRPPARIVVVGHGEPASYAGPTTAGPPRAKRRQARRQQNHGMVRGTCTAITIRLPGVMVYHGDLGPVIAEVETNLTPGEYTMSYKRKGSRDASISPWTNEDMVLNAWLEDEGWKAKVFNDYLDSMTEPVPLRVVAAGPGAANATGSGAGCTACMHLAPAAAGTGTGTGADLDADEGQALIQGLAQDLPQAERGRWAVWAEHLAARMAWARGLDQALAQGLPPNPSRERMQIETLLTTGGPRTLPPWRSARKARADPKLRASWQSLAAWEQTLWRDYLAQHGDTMDVSDPARRDLRVTGAVRFSMALRMSPQYMAPGMREAAAHLFNDPIFLGGTVFGISAYLALVVAPEPIVTKATAVLTTIALVSLAGFSASELLTLAHAWMRLRDDTAQATTLGELDAAAERFGRTIGGSAVRILAVLATVYVGTKLPSQPPPGAPATSVIQVIHVPGGGVIMTRSGAAITTVADLLEVGWAVQVLRSGAVILMASSAASSSSSSSAGGGGPEPEPGAATGGSGPSGGDTPAAPEGKRTQAPRERTSPGVPGKSRSMRVETSGVEFTPHPAIEGIREPGPIRSFTSHKAFTRYMGPAGEGKEWHHIVGQTPGNVARFTPRAIHNTANMIRIDKTIHTKINGHYSSTKAGLDMTVREWLSSQSFENQRAYGIAALRRYGVIP